MKMVPIRAVTLTRKREIEEAERDSGEKQKQGLYARKQTDWIIPPPIENGRIPKNSYGNIDCFVPTMVPMGAVHIPLRKTVMICKKLGIDYAEAVTGFEFGNKMAVPVIEGVVVSKEHEALVIDRWEMDERERRIKEEGKREKLALGTWRKWLMGLRIVERVKEEYGGNADAHLKEEKNPFTNQSNMKNGRRVGSESYKKREDAVVGVDGEERTTTGSVIRNDEDTFGGGFLPEDFNDEDAAEPSGGLVMEDTEQVAQASRRGPAVVTADPYGRPRDINGHSSPLSRMEEESDTAMTPPSKPLVKDGKQKHSKPRKSRSGKDLKRVKRKTEEPFSRLTSNKSSRTLPKRTAARKSEIAVRSQILDSDSSEHDTGDSDET